MESFSHKMTFGVSSIDSPPQFQIDDISGHERKGTGQVLRHSSSALQSRNAVHV